MAAKKKATAKRAKAGGNADRQSDGRFRKGHSVKSPGNPMIRALNAFQSAVSEAFTPDELVDVLRDMRRISRGEVAGLGRFAGVDGEEVPLPLPPPTWAERIAAAKVWIERLQGKPREPGEVIPAGLLDFELETAEDALRAAQRIALAAARGEISLDAAMKLSSLLDVVDKRKLVSLDEEVREIRAEMAKRTA